MSEHAENLKHALATELNIPPVRDAFHAWIDHMEEQLAGTNQLDRVDRFIDLVDRVTALEKAVADLHAALGSAPSPVTVQRAVADLDPPVPAG